MKDFQRFEQVHSRLLQRRLPVPNSFVRQTLFYIAQKRAEGEQRNRKFCRFVAPSLCCALPWCQGVRTSLLLLCVYSLLPLLYYVALVLPLSDIILFIWD